MKITFLFLLLANGLLFMWQSYFVAPNAIASVPRPDDMPELVLLEETGTTVQDIDVVTIEPEEPNPPSDEQPDASFVESAVPFEPAPKSCYTVGPFIDVAALKEVKQLFVEKKINFQQRTLTKRELSGYNVFLPPYPSRDAAQVMVEELIRKGITDYYLMKNTEMNNAISLGLFREYRYAIQHKEFLENKGLSPTMQSRYINRSRHWIDYTERDSKIDEDTLVRMSPESDVQRLSRNCR